MFAHEYRVVRDRFAGYEAQVRRWWFPFWCQINGCNTRSTLEASERLCRDYVRSQHLVKYLGRITAPKSEPEVNARKRIAAE